MPVGRGMGRQVHQALLMLGQLGSDIIGFFRREETYLSLCMCKSFLDFILLNISGKVCAHGSEGVCNGEYGLPHFRDAGPTGISRLLYRGSHGEGNPSN